MAGVALKVGPIAPNPTGQPGRTLPGTNVPNPTYAQDNAYWEQDQARQRQKQTDNTRGRANFESAAANGANYDSTFTDQNTGEVLHHAAAGPKFADSLGNFDTLMSRFNNLGGSSSLSGRGALGKEPRVQLDTAAIDAGDRAAYSQAKDKVGGATQGLMKSLQNQFASRGLRGSSIEGRQIGSALESGAGQLDDVARGQAVEGSRRAVDLAKTQYGGDITQRGQDIDAETADRSLDVQSQQSRVGSIMGLFNAFNGMRY
jgi:hypothetical protein